MFESIQSSISIDKIDKYKKEMSYIYRYITECVQNLQDYQEQNEINFESQNSSNLPNNYFDDDISKSEKMSNAGRTSYITQNYEKFKLQQNTNQVIEGKDKSSVSFNQSGYKPYVGNSSTNNVSNKLIHYNKDSKDLNTSTNGNILNNNKNINSLSSFGGNLKLGGENKFNSKFLNKK